MRLHVRVLDFGIARIFRRDEPSRVETLTSPGAVLGTPRYMSPEQLAGQPVDARSDLYSAAVVIHEALTGQLPYVSGKKLSELCPEASPQLQELLDQCLKPNPAERPPSAIEVYLRLQELGKASGILLLPPGAMEKLVACARNASDRTMPPEAVTTQALASEKRERGPSNRTVRRWLIGLGIALALAGVGVLVRVLFWPPAPSVKTGPESLLGVKVGDAQQDVADNLGLSRGGPVQNPWEKGSPPEYLGRVLSPAVMGLSDDELQRLDIRRGKNDEVCVVFVDGKVRSMVVQLPHTGETGRGVGVSSPVSAIASAYGQEFNQMVMSGPRPTSPDIIVRVYRAAGVGFEIQGGVVTAVALFPAAPAGQ